MCSARTIQNWKRRIKNSRTHSIILVHPSSRATSNLLCPSSEENITNFNQLFKHKQLHNSYSPIRIKDPLKWAPTPRSPHSNQQSHRLKPIAYNNTIFQQFHRFTTNLHKSWYRKGSRMVKKRKTPWLASKRGLCTVLKNSNSTEWVKRYPSTKSLN